ncbi:hypothetical protein C7974DRAFT_386220 [Boeremia exigua]|uniref:uncharacterized protein n=1 Tax=Boeremia exigua TaxID=749465 RepID=UPI001E8EE8D6|nr:uncharacterized protein C7974DRAFT_386220 [Boeremia exigua]KAH6642821.1 hypothetical protein C7974DRAFT_386220 [Boeremia exigua]
MRYRTPKILNGGKYDELGVHPGTLTTDLSAWHGSRTYIRALVQRNQGKVVLGHDSEYFHALKASPEYTQ